MHFHPEAYTAYGYLSSRDHTPTLGSNLEAYPDRSKEQDLVSWGNSKLYLVYDIISNGVPPPLRVWPYRSNKANHQAPIKPSCFNQKPSHQSTPNHSILIGQPSCWMRWGTSYAPLHSYALFGWGKKMRKREMKNIVDYASYYVWKNLQSSCCTESIMYFFHSYHDMFHIYG